MRGLRSPTTTPAARGVTRLAFGVALLAAPLVAACERETTPPLIQVVGLSPREVEEGDRLVVEGVGFPEGKTAHVAFRGDLHRPGVPAVRDVEVDVDALVTSPTELELPVSAALEQLFAGPGERAAHTTFSGDVTVAFAARSTAAPPVAGTLHDTWLDVRPPPSHHTSTAEAESAEAERTLAFVGIKPQLAPLPAGGILIESIEPGSRAEAARLLAGDVITEMSGVRVLSMRDLVTAPGDRTPWLKIRRGGSPHEELATLSLLGWKPPAATALLGPVVILSLSAILLLLFFGPTPRLVAWLERSIAARLEARPRVPTLPALAARPPIVACAGASVMVAFLPFSHYLGLGDLDAAILFLASLTALATLALFLGGTGAPRGRSVVAGIVAAARVTSLGVPVAAALVAVVMVTGSLRLEDLVRAQSGWPWGWTVFQSPLALVGFALASVSVLAGGHSVERPLPEAEALEAPAPAVPAEPRARVLFLASWVHRLVLCALGVALYLGGWQLPGLAPEQMEAHLGWTSLGAALFVGKVWLVVLALGAAEQVLPRVRPEEVMSLTWRWLAPLSLGAALLTAGWVGWGASRVPWGAGPSAETLVGAVLLALTSAAALHVATRVGHLRRERPAELDPFV